jgi:NAD(P)-dependent dehydrogenase (short-subunit alcohol dehydrogenase family)
MKLKDQVAIVTGAGRNIGEDVSKMLAREGAKIAVVDMDKARGDKVAAEIVAAGGEARGFVADVSSEADIAKLVKDTVAAFGKIDILINNAAISDNKTILEISKEQWDKVLAVTLTGPFLMSQHAARQMVAQGNGGKIVNVGSTSGFFGRSRAVAYAAAKGGVANLTRAMAVQLAPHNIRVNGVVPNKIGSPVGKDEFDPSRPVVNLRNRPGVPLDMAKAILFLVSDDSDFIVGDMLFVDGGVSAMMVGDGGPRPA